MPKHDDDAQAGDAPDGRAQIRDAGQIEREICDPRPEIKGRAQPGPPVGPAGDMHRQRNRGEERKRLEEIAKTSPHGVDIFISNVGYAATMRSLDDYKKRSLYKTFDYSTWPMIEYTQRIKARFGAYPKKVIGISSDGPEHFYQGYDYVAASKALLEFFGKYLAVHLLPEGSRVNVIRFGTVKTESFTAIFGEEFFDYIKDQGWTTEDLILKPEDCGKAVFALCSGFMDAMNGQVLNVDYGQPFADNSMMRFQQWKSKQQ